MKRIAAIVLAAMMLVFLVSCGGGDGSKEADAEYIGVYNGVWAKALDVELTGEDVPVKTLELKSDGKCVMTAQDGMESEYDYVVEGTTITISSYGADYAKASIENGTINIDDWMGLGFAYKFEKAS